VTTYLIPPYKGDEVVNVTEPGFPRDEVVGVHAGPRRHTLTTESEDLVTPNDIAEVLENCARLIRLGVRQGDATYNEKAYWRAHDALTDLEAHIDPAWLASYSPPWGLTGVGRRFTLRSGSLDDVCPASVTRRRAPGRAYPPGVPNLRKAAPGHSVPGSPRAPQPCDQHKPDRQRIRNPLANLEVTAR